MLTGEILEAIERKASDLPVGVRADFDPATKRYSLKIEGLTAAQAAAVADGLRTYLPMLVRRGK